MYVLASRPGMLTELAWLLLRCSQNWHGCYYVQEEMEDRIEKAQKQKENECVREDCESCPFLKHRKNCRLICTRTILEKQGVHMLEVTIG